MGSMKEIFNSLLLKELLKGMSVTGKYFFARKITVQYPEEKTPQSSPFPWLCTHCVAIQTVRSVVSPANCAKQFVRRWRSRLKLSHVMMVRRRTTRYDIDLTKCIFCGFCEEACPVDAVVETRVFEYHGEKRGDLYYTKQMLLANGDRYEAQIAEDRAIDAPYR